MKKTKLVLITLLCALLALFVSCDSLFEKNVTSDEDIKSAFKEIQSDSSMVALNNFTGYGSGSFSKRTVVENPSLKVIVDKLKTVLPQLREFQNDVNKKGEGSFAIDVDYSNIKLDFESLKGMDSDFDLVIDTLDESGLPTNLNDIGLEVNRLKVKGDTKVATTASVMNVDGSIESSVLLTLKPQKIIDFINSSLYMSYAPSILKSISLGCALMNDVNVNLVANYSEKDDELISATSGKIAANNIFTIGLAFNDESEFKGSIDISMATSGNISDVSTLVQAFASIDMDDPTAFLLSSELQQSLNTNISVVAYSSSGKITYSKSFDSVEQLSSFLGITLLNY